MRILLIAIAACSLLVDDVTGQMTAPPSFLIANQSTSGYALAQQYVDSQPAGCFGECGGADAIIYTPCFNQTPWGPTPAGQFGGVSPSAPFGRDVDGAPLVGPPVMLRQAKTVSAEPDPDDSLKIRELFQRILQDKLNLTKPEALRLINEYDERANQP